MDRIAEANKAATTGIDAKDIKNWIEIYIMGKAYRVPADLTILTAMEYAGYKFVRGVGCRQGFCGACATVFRKKGDYKLQTGMACQTRAEDGMYLAQIPFTPAEKAEYDITKEPYEASVFIKYYPEVTRCVSCNTCTKACPQDLEVMDYVQAAIRGAFDTLADVSFDCIQCGLCAMRCPAEIVQYHVAQLGRRMYGRYGQGAPDHLRKRVKEITEGKFNQDMEKITKCSIEELRKIYTEREKEPE
ncbi:4Fe-4S ferredoxin [candidate division WOR_3 bacterium SM1_77]|uniref:4Fe-4S ferredoxin n=1 Tax=candidate division WOR_3 bacterium SM1_77 TaxID=1703778 RepID=A0A0S8JWG6_UNCW3|nr:MAG: 4Fe-4S ferredoxin [candidate division WOR_3 bacterium SM1_77]